MPYLPLNAEVASIEWDRTFALGGALCFSLVKNISDSSACVLLYNQTMGWFDLPEESGEPCHSANATWINGWWPAKEAEEVPPHQLKWAPYYLGMNWGEM